VFSWLGLAAYAAVVRYTRAQMTAAFELETFEEGGLRT
jgi:hypothetical protein